uniref:Uncharacterized protein n=1 Tax=Leersia perrieri TaxID=77586 RepID=A0A0D9VJA5_9ORYZ
MVVGFRRTISFPAPKAAAGMATAKGEAYRVRSASLPCRFHPLVVQLDEDVAAMRATVGRLASSAASAGSVAAAAEQLGRVLVSLSELLHHPQAQEPLRRLGRSPFAERLLDDFLRLADAHGSFRGALPPPPPPAGLPADGAALAAAIADATAAVASASAAVFSGISSLSIAAATARVEVAATPCWMPSPARFSTPSGTPRHHIVTTKSSSLRVWWVADLMCWMSRAKRRSAGKQNTDADASSSSSSSSSASGAHPQSDFAVDPEERERKAAFDRLDNLGRCIADVESIGEKVFRALCPFYEKAPRAKGSVEVPVSPDVAVGRSAACPHRLRSRSASTRFRAGRAPRRPCGFAKNLATAWKSSPEVPVPLILGGRKLPGGTG